MTDASATFSYADATADGGRHLEQRRARRHTRRVRRLRVVIPIVSAIIALGLTAAAVLPKLLPFSALAGLSLTADGLVMNSPRLAGHLGEGRRYEVVADRAVQSLLNPARLTLEGLNADLDMGNDQRVTIHGNEATYNTSTEVLDVSEGVSLVSSDGNEAQLNAATVFLREGRVEGDGGIEITSPRGHIRAGRIDITEGGARIRMTGGVSIVINPAP
ncbi:LPS export ABC transporter periplasmic protein LptC [Acuticoccus mangrovi]|uniref:LPS export ABC transporter periplasmic protein LptC n=1 Tax=Acuticoccus mangrovi TaxID=2796142 RepID=A0A934MMC2_9HYPH|nr:LPS export ABC transporter periplasmic protein LptC [Acuticoccus mangrovi]MBJ3777149.1 LPS export ABC transporter periplasmic protein LptC [Acuticoccus mangrovi]